MEITTSQDGTIEIRKVFNSIILITDKGERISICMRDSGFEFMYKDVWYSAKEGKFLKASSIRQKTADCFICCFRLPSTLSIN